MEWNTTWEDPLTSYVKQFDGLIGDQRTRKTFGETVKGIIAAGSLICQQIATRSAELRQTPDEELWLIADGSDLRKPYAEVMPYLMQVRDLDKKLVPGYRTLNVIGLTPGRRCLLYHRLFSSQAPDFVSEPAEVQQALTTVSQALRPLNERKTVTLMM